MSANAQPLPYPTCTVIVCMQSMKATAIGKTIELARKHEQQTGHLRQRLDQQFDRVHMAIQLPQKDATASLLQFVIAYIDYVPEFLEVARTTSLEAHIEDHTTPCLNIAEAYFLKPPEVVQGHIGLDELMDEAYLAHRLMEEVNDRFMVSAGIPLIPMDTTLSNLVIHNLIGEPFANELDEAVHYSLERVTRNLGVYESSPFFDYVERQQQRLLNTDPDPWPCMMDHLSIKLQLAGLSL